MTIYPWRRWLAGGLLVAAVLCGFWPGRFAYPARYDPAKAFPRLVKPASVPSGGETVRVLRPLGRTDFPHVDKKREDQLLFVQWPATNLGSTPGKESWWSQLTAPLREGSKKLASLIHESAAPRTEPTYKADAISLSRPARASPQLYVALARLAEQRGRFDEAEQHYRRALEIAPADLDALLGLARLKDRLNEPDTAAQLYRKALAAHPREPAVYNDYALYLARRGELYQASQMMEEAIRLQPRRWLYRTNMAVILLELGQPEAALAQLEAVQDPASACYNLGYLAYRKGELGLAAHYFSRALEHNPQLAPARYWLDHLQMASTGGLQSTPTESPEFSGQWPGLLAPGSNQFPVGHQPALVSPSLSTMP